jgi:hypothetical protein
MSSTNNFYLELTRIIKFQYLVPVVLLFHSHPLTEILGSLLDGLELPESTST